MSRQDLDEALDNIATLTKECAALRTRVEALSRAFKMKGHEDSCGNTAVPHRHRGVDCDLPHECDCSWPAIQEAARQALAGQPEEAK